MGKQKEQPGFDIDSIEGDNIKSASPKTGTSTKNNLPSGWTRTTVTIREDHLQKLKDLAWWERALQRDVLEQILEEFFSTHEIPSPKKKKMFSDE